MTRPMSFVARWLLLLIAPLLLASCIVTPTKFVSTLDVRADRSFTFTYVGEMELMKSKTPPDFGATDEEDGDALDEGETEPLLYKIANRKQGAPDKPDGKPDEDFSDSADEATQLKALAEALSREYGFRSVRAVGGRRLAIDYAISGRLDHAFVFPFNPDGNVVLPFLAIELRGKDRVRIKAPGYANERDAGAALGGMTGLGGAGDTEASPLDGSFTLTTDAEVVSQNQEDGVVTVPDRRKRIVWRATPQTRDAPMAVLKVAPLP